MLKVINITALLLLAACGTSHSSKPVASAPQSTNAVPAAPKPASPPLPPPSPPPAESAPVTTPTTSVIATPVPIVPVKNEPQTAQVVQIIPVNTPTQLVTPAPGCYDQLHAYVGEPTGSPASCSSVKLNDGTILDIDASSPNGPLTLVNLSAGQSQP